MKLKQCPKCAEDIREAAILCKWCKADLRPAASQPQPERQELLKDGKADPIGELSPNTQQTIVAVVMVIIVLCLVWVVMSI